VVLARADEVITHPRVDSRWYGLATTCLLISGMVLLVACANLANAFLARTAARGREIAIRRAMGATSARLVRQLVTEYRVLVLAGGITAVVCGVWIARLLASFVPGMLSMPEAGAPEVNPGLPQLAYALALCGLTCILGGLLPGLRSSRADVAPRLKSSGTGLSQDPRYGVLHALVVPQVALSRSCCFW
jgi:ABC-type antimicrobial peptide transport system permease subunit